MGRDNNFSKAVKELLGNEQPVSSAPQGRMEYDESAAEPTPSRSYTESAARSSFAEQSVAAGNETVITRDTIVTGTIQSKANIRMHGQMTGDILTDQDIRITGKVDGNVDGNNIELVDGAVIGDLTGKSDVSVDSTAVVIGNVTSENVASDGRIKGSVKVTSSICLKSNAVVFGNITSRTLNVEDGAILRGNVQITSPRTDDEDLFSLSKKPAATAIEEAVGE